MDEKDEKKFFSVRKNNGKSTEVGSRIAKLN